MSDMELDTGSAAEDNAASSESSPVSASSSLATDGGEAPNAGASDAASPSASDTSSSAQAALPAVDTGVSGTSQGDAAVDPTPAVHIDVEDHAEAKERFAGLMARIHKFEAEAIDELKADLKAIGTLLHLHSLASGQAEATGDYKASDL